MIPKVIHYCWFGGNPLSDKAKMCIESWKKYLPEYELVLWDETNFDINSNKYVKEAYEAKKFAFVTDYVRLYACYTYGGIYMDTDVEVTKPLDEFLNNKGFSGFESYHDVPTGIMACEKNFEGFYNLLKYYDNASFIKTDGSYDMTTNVTTITNYYVQKGLKRNNTYQVIEGMALYPRVYFCPSVDDVEERMDEIYTIHHMAGSWLDISKSDASISYKTKLYRGASKFIRRVFGYKFYEQLRKFF